MSFDADSPPRAGLTLDVQTRRGRNGSALLGGNPFRVLRLGDVGRVELDERLRGESATSLTDSELAKKLLSGGMVHPVVSPSTDLADIGFVIPVLNDVEGLRCALASTRKASADASVVVVDDGSIDGRSVSAAAADFAAITIRHETNLGPAAARNTGWTYLLEVDPTVRAVAFVDADVVVNEEAIRLLDAHLRQGFADVVAPRVRAAAGDSALSAFEERNSPLDLGPDAAIVRPRTRVSYVPSAMLLVRRSTLEDVDGFDAELRVGEDVDFVWRSNLANHLVRYEPAAVVHHRPRATIDAMARQRFAYGTSAALLEARHPDHVFPVEISLHQLAIWLLAAFAGSWGRVGAALGFAATVRDLGEKLKPVLDDEATEHAFRLQASSHGFGLGWMSNAATRGWLPLLVSSKRGRRLLIAAFVVPAARDYVRQRPSLDPVRFAALRALDHGSYCAGTWVGAWRNRSVRSILPRWRK